jgi:hypothetical protein
MQNIKDVDVQVLPQLIEALTFIYRFQKSELDGEPDYSHPIYKTMDVSRELGLFGEESPCNYHFIRDRVLKYYHLSKKSDFADIFKNGYALLCDRIKEESQIYDDMKDDGEDNP